MHQWCPLYRDSTVLTLWLAQSNQCVWVDHAARIHSLNSPQMTSSADKNEMKMMMTIVI